MITSPATLLHRAAEFYARTGRGPTRLFLDTAQFNALRRVFTLSATVDTSQDPRSDTFRFSGLDVFEVRTSRRITEFGTGGDE